MLDIGWSELLVIGALALIVVGPKDLPKLLNSFGKYVNQIRGMARDFQRSMEDAAREADISDIKELREAARSLNEIKRMPFDAVTKPATATRNPAASPIPPAPKVAAPAPSAPMAPSPAAATPAEAAPSQPAPAAGASPASGTPASADGVRQDGA